MYRSNPTVSSGRNGWTWVYPYNAVLLISKQKWTIKTCCLTDEFQINYWVEEARQSAYSMSSFTWSSRKYKLIHSSRKQISGCLKMVGERGTQALHRDQRKLWGGDDYFYYLFLWCWFHSGVCVWQIVQVIVCLFCINRIVKNSDSSSQATLYPLSTTSPQTFPENIGWECRNHCWFTYPVCST